MGIYLICSCGLNLGCRIVFIFRGLLLLTFVFLLLFATINSYPMPIAILIIYSLGFDLKNLFMCVKVGILYIFVTNNSGFFVNHQWVLATYCVCGLGCVSYLMSFLVCASLHIQCVLVSLRRGCQSKIHTSQQFLPPRFVKKKEDRKFH